MTALGSLVVQPAIAISSATPIEEVGRLLVRHRVPALAVVDGAFHLRGLVTRTDVLRALASPAEAGRAALPKAVRSTIDETLATAGDAMSCIVFALPAGADVERAAALMAYEGVGQIVVTGLGGELVGMVSALDLARYYATRTDG